MRFARTVAFLLAGGTIAFIVAAFIPSCNITGGHGRIALIEPDSIDLEAMESTSLPYTVTIPVPQARQSNPSAHERLAQAGIEGFRLFPAALDPRVADTLANDQMHTVRLPGYSDTLASEYGKRVVPWTNSTVFSYYGRPGSKTMGILGLYSKEKVADLTIEKGREYDAVNGDKGIIPSFYIIYGGCWPAGEIGYLSDSTMIEWIEYAATRGIQVFVDHQIGKYGIEESMRKILPFLKYPNVHLALDPEWRTLAPMEEIGSVSGDEINLAQDLMQQYMEENEIEGVRMLVIHQFADRMVKGRERIRADRDGVLLVHVADGFGSPALKKHSYRRNAAATNIPLKGFKLFYPTAVVGAGWDEPLMSPEAVMSLTPEPFLIMYQ